MYDAGWLTRPPTHERRLDNGLTVLVREDHTAPVVAIVTHVKAGYFDEPDRIVGISHVLEHMYFKGTERRGVGEIARETKAAGGYLNAGTIYDYTSYYTVLPSSALEQGLDIQADALCNSEIDEAELEKELRVIIQEAKRKLDNPEAVATETLYEEMFDVHRMRRWRIGTEPELTRLGREDVWNYYRNLYRPSNIVLVVAGDVDPARTFELVERHYGGMPAGEPVKEPSPEEPDRTGFRFREMSGDIVQTYLECGWRTPGTLDPDTVALDLLAVVLGQGRASRLYRRVREAGLVTGISAYNYTPTEIGVFAISAEMLPEDRRPALEAIWREVDELRGEPVAEHELARARNILEARLLRRTETAEGQANLLANWQALGDWRLVERYLERLFAATTEDLRDAAARYLATDRGTALVYRPDASPALGWSAEALEPSLAEAVERAGVRGAEPVEGGTASSGIGQATGAAAAPAEERAASADAGPSEADAVGAPNTGPSPVPTRIEDGVHLHELSNGVRVVVKPRHAVPLVAMAVCCRGGALHETPATAGLTGLIARTSLKGTTTRSAAGIAEETEALGGSISPGVSADVFRWTLSLPSRHFAHGLELLADVALEPTFPEDEVERERKVALSDLERVRDDMYRFPHRLFMESAFHGHAYGISMAQREAAIRVATADDLRRWHRRETLEAAPWVFVVGDVDPDDAARRVGERFGAVPGGEPRDGAGPPVWPDGPREASARREKAQTALTLGFPGVARDDEDLYALEVLSNIVTGLGGRFFDELRDRRSLAYTVAAYPIVRWLGGAFVAYIATSPEKEDEARRALLEQFERLSDENVTREELERAQRYAIGAWKIRSQTNGAQLGDLADALLLGDGIAEIREFEDRIRAVTPVRIREAVRRRFAPDRLVVGVVRGSGGGR